MKDAACAAIHGDINQYAITWGAPVAAPRDRREVPPLVRHAGRLRDAKITVTCGATEAMASVFLALIDPGDEVIVFEPFYENYGPDAILAGAKPVFVPLEPPDWQFDPDRLRAAFTTQDACDHRQHAAQSDRARVFTREERRSIADLCIEHDVWAFTDEIYEHIRLCREPPPAGDVPRHARAHGHDLRSLEDVQLHRLAPRLRIAPAGAKRSRSARCTTS